MIWGDNSNRWFGLLTDWAKLLVTGLDQITHHWTGGRGGEWIGWKWYFRKLQKLGFRSKLFAKLCKSGFVAEHSTKSRQASPERLQIGMLPSSPECFLVPELLSSSSAFLTSVRFIISLFLWCFSLAIIIIIFTNNTIIGTIGSNDGIVGMLSTSP